MDVDPRDTALVIDAVRNRLPSPWTEWPGGWPGRAEAALIDAVLSIRAVYGQPHNGVRGAIQRWQSVRNGAPLDDLGVLASRDPNDLATVLGNHQRLRGGSTKAAAIVTAASKLAQAGTRHAADLIPPTPEAKRAYTNVNGLGPVTWTYLLMLLGIPDIKADTWIVRFTDTALDRPTTPPEARSLLQAVAAALGTSPTALDHAVWNYARRAL